MSKDRILFFKKIHNFLRIFKNGVCLSFWGFFAIFFLRSKVKTDFMVYKVPHERSFEYKLIKSYTPLMCTAGMNNFRINKPMHKSSSIIETNWVSKDAYHSCSMILVWVSQADNHKDYWPKSSNHKNNRLKTAKLIAKGNYRSLGEPLLDLFLSYRLWFLFCGLLFFSLVCSGWDWGREKLKEGSSQIWGEILGSTCRSEHICGWVLLSSETVSLQQSLLWSLTNFGDSQLAEVTAILEKKIPKAKLESSASC